MKTYPLQPLWQQPDAILLQARLNALPGSSDNVYEMDEWTFQDIRQRKYTISFVLSAKVLGKYPEWLRAQGIDPMSLTKQLFLLLAERIAVSSYRVAYRGLLSWLAAMANSNIMKLDRGGLSEVLTFRLTHTLSVNGVHSAPFISSYNSLSALGLTRLQAICEELGLDWFGRGLSDAVTVKALKSLIPTLTEGELTYKDWKQGKSFNLLTLDHGQYYVEHCLNVFEEHFPLALALKQTMLDAPKIYESLDLSSELIPSTLTRILEGHSAEEINKDAPNHIRRIQNAVLDHFRALYRQTRFEHELLQDCTLRDFAEALSLPQSPENIDRIRIIVSSWLNESSQKETEQLLNQCQNSIPWSLFKTTLESIKQRSFSAFIFMPTTEFFSRLGFEYNGGVGMVNQFVSWVAKAGLTSVVALTGWRKSEFGFPWSKIQRSRNTDKLDEYAFPYRYQVDWYVYKTNGKVRALREITFGTVNLINRLRLLNASDPNEPCLYSTTAAKQDAFNSDIAVEKAVIGLWPHFVHQYPGFILLDDLTIWQSLKEKELSGGLLSMQQHREKERLLARRSAQDWGSLKIDENLRTAWHKARTDWPRISFMWSKNEKSNQGWLVKYRQKLLHRDWTDILDTHLSTETRNWFFSLKTKDIASRNEISRTIMNELMCDALYPSPHAFRHMWAESVYRRFDGDAGWIIRSQFKHISQTMWLAYIRDKDNRPIHQRSKLAAINSLVANFLRHNGEGYAGQMNTLLRRLSKKTKILTPDEQKKLAATLASQEIENLKANPWGYCLLMRRSRHMAKCADGGEPLRHNASPDLCLGCIHNLMQTSNVEWMIFHISPHVEALKNPIVPDLFKKSSYDLVRNTARHVRKLNPDHDALTEIETVLSNYQRAA